MSLEITLGPLQALSLGNQSSDEVVVLMHGYGANMHDLSSLSQLRPDLRWVFLNAPIVLADSLTFEGRAWFELDYALLQEASRHSNYHGFYESHAPGFAQAQEQIRQALDALNHDAQSITLGGFSQGAIVATNYFLQSPEDYNALIILSGVFVEGLDWLTLCANKPKRPIFQSHGRQDPLLSFASAEMLHTAFAEESWPIEWLPFDGGHELPAEALFELRSFLSRAI